MQLSKKEITRIIDKQGQALRQYDNTLHFLCEAISSDNFDLNTKDTMWQTIQRTPHYKALLFDLLKKSVPDRERHTFIAFTTELSERGVTYQVPIGNVPYSYADNKLLFPTVQDAVHWLTTTCQKLILENSKNIEAMVKYLTQLIKRDETGVVMSFLVTYVDRNINFAFAVRSVMEWDSYTKYYIAESQYNEAKKIIDALLGDDMEYADIFRKQMV
jgi:hypothetical protein